MTLRDTFDRSDPNVVADALRAIGFGQTLQQDVKQTLRRLNPDALGAGPHDLATLDSVQLPDDAKACVIIRAYARAGTAGAGELTLVGRNSTPASGQIAIAPSGNIVVLAADALTDLDISYIPERADVREYEGTVAADVLTLPVQLTSVGVVGMIAVEATAGTATGTKIILAPGAALPAAGQARLNVAMSTVTFAAADAVTYAKVKLQLVAVKDLSTLLNSATSIV